MTPRRRAAAIQFRAFLALSVFMKLGVRRLTPRWDLSTALAAIVNACAP
jgi:hypothetical protein